jgi:hypothetical protein
MGSIKDFKILIDNNGPRLIDRIIVSQEDNSILDIKNEENDDNSAKEVYVKETLESYVVTYNKEENSITGWSTIIEKDGRQKPVKYVNFNELNYDIYPNSFVLSKEFLILLYHDKNDDYIARINLSGGEDLVKLKCERNLFIKRNSVGLLPNGDIILVSLNDESKDYKIYKYNNQLTTNTSPQIYDIKIDGSLEERININCFIYQTKLFLFNEHQMAQWNLNENEITFDKQYFLDDMHDPSKVDIFIVINKNQTLLAINISPDIIDIFSMKTGMRISRYG